jgi:hypothetical protein
MTGHDRCDWDLSHNLFLFDPLRDRANSRERRKFAGQEERNQLHRIWREKEAGS